MNSFEKIKEFLFRNNKTQLIEEKKKKLKKIMKMSYMNNMEDVEISKNII